MRVYPMFNINHNCMLRHLEPPPQSSVQWCGETEIRLHTSSFLIFSPRRRSMPFQAYWCPIGVRIEMTYVLFIPKGKNLKAAKRSAQIKSGKTTLNHFMATKDLAQTNVKVLLNDNFIWIHIFPFFVLFFIHKSLAKRYGIIWAWLETPIQPRNNLYFI